MSEETLKQLSDRLSILSDDVLDKEYVQSIAGVLAKYGIRIDTYSEQTDMHENIYYRGVLFDAGSIQARRQELRTDLDRHFLMAQAIYDVTRGDERDTFRNNWARNDFAPSNVWAAIRDLNNKMTFDGEPAKLYTPEEIEDLYQRTVFRRPERSQGQVGWNR